jgi:hypothetical protein
VPQGTPGLITGGPELARKARERAVLRVARERGGSTELASEQRKTVPFTLNEKTSPKLSKSNSSSWEVERGKVSSLTE